MMPFAMNDSTRFISPTKTPEYLAAGLPVVSTPDSGCCSSLRRTRSGADWSTRRMNFAPAVEQAMTCGMSLKWRERADGFLATLSWECDVGSMNHLIMSAR